MLSAVDGHDVSEAKVVLNFIHTVGLSVTDLEAAASIGSSEMIRTISQFTDAEKSLVMGYWFSTIKADGRISIKEKSAIIDLAYKCNMDPDKL